MCNEFIIDPTKISNREGWINSSMYGQQWERNSRMHGLAKLSFIVLITVI